MRRSACSFVRESACSLVSFTRGSACSVGLIEVGQFRMARPPVAFIIMALVTLATTTVVLGEADVSLGGVAMTLPEGVFRLALSATVDFFDLGVTC